VERYRLKKNLVKVSKNDSAFLYNIQLGVIYRSAESLVLGDYVAENRGADYVEHLVPSPLAPESGSRGFFSPSPHNTWHAGPHQAFHEDYRAVAG